MCVIQINYNMNAYIFFFHLKRGNVSPFLFVETANKSENCEVQYILESMVEYCYQIRLINW